MFDFKVDGTSRLKRALSAVAASALTVLATPLRTACSSLGTPTKAVNVYELQSDAGPASNAASSTQLLRFVFRFSLP